MNNTITETATKLYYSTLADFIQVIHISSCTIYFIIQQAIIEIQNNSTPIEKCLLALFIYEFIITFYKIAKLNAKTRKLETELQAIMLAK